MARVYNGKKVWLTPWLSWLEQGIYRVCGVYPQEEMGWRRYAAVILGLGMAGFLFLFMLFSLQGVLPFNSQGFAGLPPDLAFNTAISFVTNTNWQNYGGESALSYLSQMAGCTVQNFLSAATGMAVAVALFRALSRKQVQTIGNPYADITRGIVYILLPMAFAFSLFLVTQGVVQTFKPYVAYQPLEASGFGIQVSGETKTAEAQSPKPEARIALGPVASQVSIKMLGSNGGGFFNANGAHPFENPTPLSNMMQILSILLIPAAFTYTFGIMAGDRRQGWMVLAAMLTIFVPLAFLCVMGERVDNPRLDAAIEQAMGNMEGKEARFGADSSALWAAATSATSNGSVNAMHDSFLPLSGLVPMLMIQFGEIVFGGVGSGMYGILIFVLLTVFIGGLMVGRTPEYLGKKLGVYEIKMASLVILIPACAVLLGTALAVSTEAGRTGVFNPGAQGFSEVLYAFSSAANNNGSAFAGLSGNSPFYNLALGIAMFIGRYWVMVPVLAIAGSLAAKNAVPPSAGTLPTHTPLFMAMLVGVIAVIGVLTYVPALALGPVAEHMHLMKVAGGVP